MKVKKRKTLSIDPSDIIELHFGVSQLREIKDMLNTFPEAQKEIFWKCFPKGISSLTGAKLKTAHTLCLRTVKGNIKIITDAAGLKQQLESAQTELVCANTQIEKLNVVQTELNSVNEQAKVVKKELLLLQEVKKYNSTAEREEGVVSISTGRLESLIESREVLNALEAGGVDNWEWYGESLTNAGLNTDE